MYKIVSSINSNPQETIFQLQQDILFLYEILDKKFEDIIGNINSSIYDYPSALKAKDFYNKNWFCDLLMSVENKIKVAILLKKLGNNYGVKSATWDFIANGSSSILEQIDILQNKKRFKKNFEG